MFIVAIMSGLGRWAIKQKYERKYEEKVKEMEKCCGEGCCDHENKEK